MFYVKAGIQTSSLANIVMASARLQGFALFVIQRETEPTRLYIIIAVALPSLGC